MDFAFTSVGFKVPPRFLYVFMLLVNFRLITTQLLYMTNFPAGTRHQHNKFYIRAAQIIISYYCFNKMAVKCQFTCAASPVNVSTVPLKLWTLLLSRRCAFESLQERKQLCAKTNKWSADNCF